MGKSLFPLSPSFEDDRFDDPDAKFKTLPFYRDIPEVYTESYKTPPFHFQFFRYQTCRHKTASVGAGGFVGGWVFLGHGLSQFQWGRAVTRWRALWTNLCSGIVGSMIAVGGLYLGDLTCSPVQTGRRRAMFAEESVRHALNARFGVFENVNKIMMSKERIGKQEFFENIVRSLEKAKEMEREKNNDRIGL
jgi:hypothetical protein